MLGDSDEGLELREDIIAIRCPEEEEKAEVETHVGEDPSKDYGRKRYLDKHGPEMWAKLIELVDLIREVNPELGEPDWSAAPYVSFSHRSFKKPLWASVRDSSPNSLSLWTRNEQGLFDATDLARRLRMKLTQGVQRRYDRVRIAIEPGQEIDTPAFRAFLKQSFESFKNLHGIGSDL